MLRRSSNNLLPSLLPLLMAFFYISFNSQYSNLAAGPFFSTFSFVLFSASSAIFFANQLNVILWGRERKALRLIMAFPIKAFEFVWSKFLTAYILTMIATSLFFIAGAIILRLSIFEFFVSFNFMVLALGAVCSICTYTSCLKLSKQDIWPTNVFFAILLNSAYFLVVGLIIGLASLSFLNSVTSAWFIRVSAAVGFVIISLVTIALSVANSAKKFTDIGVT